MEPKKTPAGGMKAERAETKSMIFKGLLCKVRWQRGKWGTNLDNFFLLSNLVGKMYTEQQVWCTFGMDTAVVLSLLMLLTDVLCGFQSLQTVIMMVFNLWWLCAMLFLWILYCPSLLNMTFCYMWVKIWLPALLNQIKISIPGCWNELQVLCNTFIPLHCYYLVHCHSSNNENLCKNNVV